MFNLLFKENLKTITKTKNLVTCLKILIFLLTSEQKSHLKIISTSIYTNKTYYYYETSGKFMSNDDHKQR